VATIPHDEVLGLARLARLGLSAAETELFARQLGDILEFARQVNAVDTSSVEAITMEAEGQDSGRWRNDVPQPSLAREAVLDLAPEADRETGLFVVPRVLGE
jgi:aspartyl-tRNA(Asn)/glutamyl-tRNA(Gln) amidotransferase subunit C